MYTKITDNASVYDTLTWLLGDDGVVSDSVHALALAGLLLAILAAMDLLDKALPGLRPEAKMSQIFFMIIQIHVLSY